MEFRDLLSIVAKENSLPEMAVKHLDSILPDSIKNELLRKTPEEATEIITYAIRMVSKGSKEKIVELIAKQL